MALRSRKTPRPAELRALAEPMPTLERKILRFLLEGYTDRAIAIELNLSERTIQRRVSRLMRRADAQSRTQLGWKVAKLGWSIDWPKT